MLGLIIIPEHVDINDDAENPSITKYYKHVGQVDAFTVRASALIQIPGMVDSSFGILYRRLVNVRQISYDTFSIEAQYGRRKREIGQWSFDFDTTGGTAHISTSLQHLARYDDDVNAEPGPWPTIVIPKHSGLIGVDKDDVKGVDIVAPALKFNIVYHHPEGFVDISWMKLIHDITGSVNSTYFLGFPPGEILFLGGRGTDGSDFEATISYSFAGAPNTPLVTSPETSVFKIGDIWVTPIDAPPLPANPPTPGAEPPYDTEPFQYLIKRGWDVIWVKYKDEEQEGFPVKKAQYAYIERVYKYVDLASILNIQN